MDCPAAALHGAPIKHATVMDQLHSATARSMPALGVTGIGSTPPATGPAVPRRLFCRDSGGSSRPGPTERVWSPGPINGKHSKRFRYAQASTGHIRRRQQKYNSDVATAIASAIFPVRGATAEKAFGRLIAGGSPQSCVAVHRVPLVADQNRGWATARMPGSRRARAVARVADSTTAWAQALFTGPPGRRGDRPPAEGDRSRRSRGHS